MGAGLLLADAVGSAPTAAAAGTDPAAGWPGGPGWPLAVGALTAGFVAARLLARHLRSTARPDAARAARVLGRPTAVRAGRRSAAVLGTAGLLALLVHEWAAPSAVLVAVAAHTFASAAGYVLDVTGARTGRPGLITAGRIGLGAWPVAVGVTVGTAALAAPDPVGSPALLGAAGLVGLAAHAWAHRVWAGRNRPVSPVLDEKADTALVGLLAVTAVPLAALAWSAGWWGVDPYLAFVVTGYLAHDVGSRLGAWFGDRTRRRAAVREAQAYLRHANSWRAPTELSDWVTLYELWRIVAGHWATTGAGRSPGELAEVFAEHLPLRVAAWRARLDDLVALRLLVTVRDGEVDRYLPGPALRHAMVRGPPPVLAEPLRSELRPLTTRVRIGPGVAARASATAAATALTEAVVAATSGRGGVRRLVSRPGRRSRRRRDGRRRSSTVPPRARGPPAPTPASRQPLLTTPDKESFR